MVRRLPILITVLAVCAALLSVFAIGQTQRFRGQRYYWHPPKSPASQAAPAPKTRHDINIWVSRNVAPGPKIRMVINTLNVSTVHAVASRIDPVEWFRYPDRQNKRPPAKGGPVRQWDISLSKNGSPIARGQQERYFSRQVNMPPMSPGAYLLVVRGAGIEKWTVVNITNLAVVTKQSPYHLLAWVTDAKEKHVVPGAQVMVFSRKGDLFKSGRTQSDGTFFTPSKAGDWTVVVSKNGDYAGVPSSAFDPDGKLVAHFQTDRPIYRPGQTVEFKSILRRTQGQGYRPLVNEKVNVQVRDPKNNPIENIVLKSNEFGTVAGKFDLPQEGALGGYSLVLTVDKSDAYHSFTVEEYRKPEYKAEAAPEQKRYLAGEPVRFTVNAQYYFGAPVQQAEIHYRVWRSSMGFGGSDEDRWYYGGDGNLYPRDNYATSEPVAEDVAHTDEHGVATIEVKSDSKAPDSTYSIECTITDSARRQVETSTSVPVYSANVRVGLSTDVLYVPVGRLIPISIRLVDLDGKAVGGTVTLVVTHQVWNEKKNETEEVELARTKVSVPASGSTRAAVPAKAEGDLTIKAFAPDGTGRVAKTEMSAYAIGPFEREVTQQQGPILNIKLDRRVYKPGDVANAHISSNTKGSPVLLVLEGLDIWSYKVVPGPVTWPIQTNAKMSPNAFVSAVQWVKGDLISGGAILPVPDRSRLLNVKVTPDKKEYRPGDKAIYTVETKTREGNPAPAEVSLSVVDEAIYALSPDNTQDLYGLYWGLRQNQVVMHQSAPQELSGGAFQGVPQAGGRAATVPVRNRFVDTAFWDPSVITGPDGVGTVSFEMPGNLTTWRANARAVTPETSVGSDAAKVVATRPVTLRLATPRQMVQGDKLTLIGTVNNRTPQSHSYKVRLTPEGMKVDSPLEQQVTVAGNSAATVEWVLNADQLGQTPPSLTAEVSPTDVPDSDKADYSDALQMKFPVNPDGVPVTILTGGAITSDATAVLDLPSDRIEPATRAEVKVWSGVKPVMAQAAQDVIDTGRYSSLVAADQLEVAPLLGLGPESKPVREALALIYKNQSGEGWGHWERDRARPQLTARVVRALAMVKDKYQVSPQVLASAAQQAKYQYDQTNLWEARALLASALSYLDKDQAAPLLDEVVARGIKMSPYARLSVARAYLDLGKSEPASKIIDDVMSLVSVGPTTAFLPTGDGIGWYENDVETTAQLLSVLVAANTHPDLQPKIAQWLISPNEQEWLSTEDETAEALALNDYLAKHPPAGSVGAVQVTVGSRTIDAKPGKIGDVLTAQIPPEALSSGANQIAIKRTGDGEAFYQVRARVFRPLKNDADQGIRVARRYEVQNSAGVWQELQRPVKAGEPVRCTVLVWGDDLPDSVKVTEPLPAGFEVADEDAGGDWNREVRDNAVIHYYVGRQGPIYFRYYLRAESEGELHALPASAFVLRRPQSRGQTSEEIITIVK